MSNLGHAGHQSAVIVVLLDIIDTSAVVIDSLYRRIIKYGGGCCCCCLSRQRIHRIHRICRIRRRSVVGAARWWITLYIRWYGSGQSILVGMQHTWDYFYIFQAASLATYDYNQSINLFILPGHEYAVEILGCTWSCDLKLLPSACMLNVQFSCLMLNGNNSNIRLFSVH